MIFYELVTVFINFDSIYFDFCIFGYLWTGSFNMQLNYLNVHTWDTVAIYFLNLVLVRSSGCSRWHSWTNLFRHLHPLKWLSSPCLQNINTNNFIHGFKLNVTFLFHMNELRNYVSKKKAGDPWTKYYINSQYTFITKKFAVLCFCDVSLFLYQIFYRYNTFTVFFV